MSIFTKTILGFLGLIFLGVFIMQSIEKDAAKQSEAQRVASMTPAQRAKENAARTKRDTELQMAGMGAATLKKSMKDPGSFELKSLVVKPSGAACYEYRAKNSFGATFPSNAVLSSKGKLLAKETNGNAFVEVWNKECTAEGGDDITELVKRLGIL